MSVHRIIELTVRIGKENSAIFEITFALHTLFRWIYTHTTFFPHVAASTSVSWPLIYVRSTCMGHLSQFVRLYWRYMLVLCYFRAMLNTKGVASRVRGERGWDRHRARERSWKLFSLEILLVEQ